MDMDHHPVALEADTEISDRRHREEEDLGHRREEAAAAARDFAACRFFCSWDLESWQGQRSGNTKNNRRPPWERRTFLRGLRQHFIPDVLVFDFA
jgi:hypothetical protein